MEHSLKDFAAIYQKLASALEAEPWFHPHWKADAGFFPNAEAPKSAFIQLSKAGWFNEEGKGIHFESWMTHADAARGTANVVLHIESSKARTGINGKTLVKSLFARSGKEIASWEGYQLKESYTMQPFIRKLVITPGNLLETLQCEFNRLVGIADSIDQAIREAKEG